MSINQVILIGRLGKNPEIRKTNNGTDVAKFSMATSKKIKGDEVTQWHNIVVFGKVVPYLAKVGKGDRIYIEGELTYRSYEKDGVTKYITEVVANKVEFIDFEAVNDTESAPTNNDDELPF